MSAKIGNKHGLGHVKSDEAKKKISDANKGKTPFLGKTHTSEARKRLSDARKISGIKVQVEDTLTGSFFIKANAVIVSQELNVSATTVRNKMANGGLINKRYKVKAYESI